MNRSALLRASGLPVFPPASSEGYPQCPCRIPRRLRPDQRKAAAALLRQAAAPAADLGRRFARHGHALALVGGSVRNVFLGRPISDLDLATDARPERVLEITRGWADKVWETGIEFGTVGLRKGGTIFEITTYRSVQATAPTASCATVEYGTSLDEDLRRRDFTVNAMAARLPSMDGLTRSAGWRT